MLPLVFCDVLARKGLVTAARYPFHQTDAPCPVHPWHLGSNFPAGITAPGVLLFLFLSLLIQIMFAELSYTLILC